jgi:hypothetical protein
VSTSENSFYIKYCKFFNRSEFLKKLGQSVQSKKLLTITDYLNENFKLLPNEILTTSISTFLLLFIPLAVFFLQVHLILGIVIPLLISYFVAYKVFSYPLTRYRQIQHTLLQYSDLAFQDLVLILHTTNSVFDAIQFISQAGYPVLSDKFKQMIFKIKRKGKSPETLIYEFIDKLPSGDLKERLITVMATKFHPDRLLEQMESLAGEKKFEYATITTELESKIIIIVGICLFFPLIIALFLSFIGFVGNFLTLLTVPGFIIALHKLKDRLLRTYFQLFGETGFLEKDELGSDDSELIEFLHFLTYFGNELKRKFPQEIALRKGFHAYQGPLENAIEQCVQEIYLGKKSFNHAWNQLRTAFEDPQIHFLMDLVTRMIEKSSAEAGSRIISTLQQLKANRELIREREGIIKAQQFKVKFLIFVSAAILGLVAGLTPMLIHIGNLISLPESELQVTLLDALPIIIALGFMTLYSGYFLTNLVKISRPSQFAIWSFLTFFILCFITGSFFMV